MAKLPQKIKSALPFLPLFIDEVTEQQLILNKRRKRYELSVNISVVILSLGNLLSDTIKFNASHFVLIALLILSAINLIVSYWMQFQIRKKYKHIFKENIHGFITEHFAANWIFSTDKIPFDEKDQQSAHIFERNIRLLKNNYTIKGHFHHHPLIIRKVSVALRENRRQSIFKGLLLTMDFPHPFKDKVVITPRSSHTSISAIGTSSLALHQLNFNVHTDVDPNFTKYFKLYSTKAGECPEFLTQIFQRQLAHFITDHKIQLHLYFTDGRLYASIRTNRDYFKPEINKPELIEAAATDYYEEVNVLMDLLKRMEQGQLFKEEKMNNLPQIA